MIKWHCVEAGATAPPDRPYRVTRYKAHWYWGFPIAGTYRQAFFRRYWQANAVSFIYHHLFGYSCNTWRRKDGTEPARLQEPA